MKHLGMDQVCNLQSVAHMTELPVIFGLIDVLFNLSNLLSRASFHFVTDRAKVLTDHNRSGLPLLATFKHFRTI